MKKWEYLVVRFDLEELDSQGKAGWELVAVSGDYFFFKRELSTPTGEEFANSKAEGKGAGMSGVQKTCEKYGHYCQKYGHYCQICERSIAGGKILI